MSGPQPWPGPRGEATGQQPAGNIPPPPADPPTAAAPSAPAPRGTGKVVAWTVAGTLMVGAIIVGAVLVFNTLWGAPAGPEPLAGSSGQGQTASAQAPARDAAPQAAAPQEPAAQEPQPEPSAIPADQPDTSGWSNADKAYCKWQGKVVFVAASDSFRAAICEINGSTTYLGLDKKAGTTIVLPATRGSNSAQAHNGSYTYSLNASKFVITANNDEIAEEKMLTWWTPGAQELRLPGDLGLSQPISYPACNGTGVIVLATSFNPATNAADVQRALDNNPGSMYLRTDLSCDNFRGPSIANSGGNSIYAVVKAVPGSKSAVCAAMKQHDATGEWLENNVDPAKNIQCP